MKKMKASFELEVETLAQKWEEEKKDLEEKAKKAKSELDSANEIIAAMKMKEEEMAKKEKMMKRKASLLDAGLEESTATETIEKFENMDDDSFEAMTSILAAMKMKKMASESEEAVAALEEVETEEEAELSVGSDETETPAESIRSELLEFVSARLHKN